MKCEIPDDAEVIVRDAIRGSDVFRGKWFEARRLKSKEDISVSISIFFTKGIWNNEIFTTTTLNKNLTLNELIKHTRNKSKKRIRHR